MPSHFRVTLDTKPPIVSIHAPSYSTLDQPVPIGIVTNEKISEYDQDIYIVDHDGNRFDLTLVYQETGFFGLVYLNQLSVGIATIYANIADEVRNIGTATAYLHITIIPANALKLKLASSVRKVDTGIKARSQASMSHTRVLETGVTPRTQHIRSHVRRMVTSETQE